MILIMKKSVYWKWIIVVILGGLFAIATFVTQHQPLEPLPFSAPIENTNIYTCTKDDKLTTSDDILSPQNAAFSLASLYLDDLMTPSNDRTFRITEYKNLSVDLYPTLAMDDEMSAIYGLKDYEKADNTWIMEINVMFQYEGIITPIGSIENTWIDVLYQASPIGFLLVCEEPGAKYTMQSRYVSVNR
jgi:hypothetical protein